MMLPRLLPVLVLVDTLSGVFSCGATELCKWNTCTHEWRNYWSPGISTGQCVNQHRNAHHKYTTQEEDSAPCPSPVACSPSTQYRTMCSCKNAYACLYHDWSNWEGEIAPGTCGRQSRYRDYIEQIRYDEKVDNCIGIPSSCGSRMYSYRDWCNDNN